MSELDQDQEVAIIPAGSYVSIMGCRFTLLEDTKVATSQESLDYVLKAQQDFENGIGTVKAKGCFSSSQ
ncbi:hypothetical protein [Alkanindiges illinoisensis]|uniref:hypothetical protein n=1 Tax=Alkanindiges illinoisensis TaxID=197183 RepID=UPI00047B5EA2|nr:hypothetical protein [Alkanindiges illinoisensis]